MSPRLFGAACALLGCAVFAQESGYVRTRVPSSDLCLHWQTRKYTYHYGAAGSEQTPGTDEFVAMDAAVQSWRALSGSCSDFVFERGPDVAVANVGYTAGAADNTNVIVFRDVACRDVVPTDDACIPAGTCSNKYQCWEHSDATIALTTTTFSFRTGIVYDADVELNAAPHQDGSRFLFTTVSSPPCEPNAQSGQCAATDIQNTLTHELGHVIGLDHVDAPGSTMEASAPLGETSKRVIDSGTADGFCSIYPKGQIGSPPCADLDSVEKKVVAVNVGTSGFDQLGCSAAGHGAGWLGLIALSGAARKRGQATFWRRTKK